MSKGISTVQGADQEGPTTVLRSAARMDHLKTGGTLLNQKFTPRVLANEKGMFKVAQLVRTYVKLDGHHIQFNAVDAETFRRAQQSPKKYRGVVA